MNSKYGVMFLLTGNFIISVLGSLPPVSTSDRIVFKNDNMSDEMRNRVKYAFFLIETNGTVEDNCGFLKDHFDNLSENYRWTCVQGVEKVTQDEDTDAMFAVIEYLPPGLGWSFKGVYLSYDGSLKSASNYLLLARTIHKCQPCPVPSPEPGKQLQAFFFNSPYFLAVFLSIMATVIVWQKPKQNQENNLNNVPLSN